MRYLFLIVAFLGMQSPAFACQCYKSDIVSGYNAYYSADIIAKGTVTSVSDGFGGVIGPRLSIAINDVIKGNDVPKSLNLNYNNNLEACGHKLKIGDEALFAIYDLRDLGADQRNIRGGGFRLMDRCQTNDIQFYLKKYNNEIIEEDE